MSSSRAQHRWYQAISCPNKNVWRGGGGLSIFSLSYPASLSSATRYPNVQKKKQQQEQQ